jgi:hypothetical protein
MILTELINIFCLIVSSFVKPDFSFRGITPNGLVHTTVPDLLSNTQFTVFRAIQQKELSFRFQAFC